MGPQRRPSRCPGVGPERRPTIGPRFVTRRLWFCSAAAANIPAEARRGAMIDIRMNMSWWLSQWWPDRLRPNTRSAAGAGRRDDLFVQSVAELSRRAGARLARQSAVDPGSAAQARRAALQAYDRARARRRRWALGF